MSATDTPFLCRIRLHRWRYANRWKHGGRAFTYRVCRRPGCTAERRYL